MRQRKTLTVSPSQTGRLFVPVCADTLTLVRRRRAVTLIDQRSTGRAEI